MARVIAGMTVSVDGFVADAEGGLGGLYPDLVGLRPSSYMRTMIAETGAVVMGRNTFAMAADPDWYAGNYEFQNPIFVVTHQPPARHPRQDDELTFTFVTDGEESAVRQAGVAAADKAVTVVGGPALICRLLVAGLVDELRVDVMPVLMGSGQRLFDEPRLSGVRLSRTSVEQVGARTSLRFAVTSGAVAVGSSPAI